MSMTYKEFCEKHKISLLVWRPVPAAQNPHAEPGGPIQNHFYFTITTRDTPIHSGYFSMGLAAAYEALRKNKHKLGFNNPIRDHLEQVKKNPMLQYRKLRPEFEQKLADTAATWIKGDPEQVLMCLAMDAQGCDEPFEDWARDLGYDPDSRKAYAIWEACNTERRALQKALGSDAFNELMECEE